jgi:hypothetical protein
MSGGRVKLAAAVVVGLVMAGGAHGKHWHMPSLDSVTAVHLAGNDSANVKLGAHLAAARYGWSGSQFSCLYDLWEGESGWSQYADTRASGLDPAGASVFAYGIPQARGHGSQSGGVTAPYPSWVQAANPSDAGGSSDAREQEIWGLWYIHGAYGSPCAALAFKRASGNQGY